LATSSLRKWKKECWLCQNGLLWVHCGIVTLSPSEVPRFPQQQGNQSATNGGFWNEVGNG
jgi:hypothetical protein